MAKNKKRTWIIVVIVILIVAVIGAVIFSQMQKSSGTAGYKTIEAKQGDLEKSISATGAVSAFDTYTVVATKPGVVGEVKYEAGDFILAKQTVTAVESAYYRSEIDGFISEIFVKEGQRVNVGDPLFMVTDYSELFVNVFVSEANLDIVNKGQAVKVNINALEQYEFSGKIDKVSYDGTNVGGAVMFQVEIMLDNSEAGFDSIRNNMSAEIKIIADSITSAIILPVKAIQYDKDQAFVYVGENMQKVNVEIGLSDGIDCVITSGLNGGEQIRYQDNSGMMLPFPMMR